MTIAQSDQPNDQASYPAHDFSCSRTKSAVICSNLHPSAPITG